MEVEGALDRFPIPVRRASQKLASYPGGVDPGGGQLSIPASIAPAVPHVPAPSPGNVV